MTTTARSIAIRLAHLTLAASLGVLSSCTASSQDNTDALIAPGALKPGTLEYDKAVFSALLDDHAKIRRTVTPRPDGIEAVTESDDPLIAARLQDHVLAMKDRLHTGRRLRQWDPLYVAVFDDADHITLEVTRTAKGVRVIETSNDPHVAEIIRIHAGVVSGYVREGNAEAARAHAVPER